MINDKEKELIELAGGDINKAIEMQRKKIDKALEDLKALRAKHLEEYDAKKRI